MIITKGIEIRLYPTKGQANMINKNIGAARVAYNAMLYRKKKHYDATQESLNVKPVDLYEEFPWMKEVDSRAITSAYMDLNSAYNNWFNSLKKKTKQVSNAPKFKQKGNSGSYRNTSMPSEPERLFRNEKIFIPMLKLTSFRNDIDISSIKKIRNLTIKRSTSGKYYCSICCDCEIIEHEHTGEVIGIDLGIKDLVIDSNGNKYSNPKYQVKAEKKIKHLQRLYSKKEKGSKNQEKARLKLATAHEKLCNKRKDNLHKITTKLIKENDVICIENLNVKGMTKNHHLAKAIQDCSFGTLVLMLKYKAAWNNRQIIEVGRFYPSSKLCSCCGRRMQYMGLEVREWTCPNCGETHDRDVNAAINIKNEGLRILDSVGQELPDSKPVKNPPMDDQNISSLKSSGSLKQENHPSLAGD